MLWVAAWVRLVQLTHQVDFIIEQLRGVMRLAASSTVDTESNNFGHLAIPFKLQTFASCKVLGSDQVRTHPLRGW